MAHDLNIPSIATAQSAGQHQTSNDADAALGDALSDIYTVDFTAGNVTLTSAQFRSAAVFVASNLSATRVLTLPAVKRPFMVYNPDAVDTITLTKGATTLSIGPTKIATCYTDGTANGLVGTVLDSGVGISVASTTEVLTGTDAAKAVTPDALAALWEKGSDIASAGTISIGEGGYFHVTGTTTITDIDWAVASNGRAVWLVFDGALTLTYNATTLKLPRAANITTAANDCALFVQDAGDNAICLSYVKADGTALVGSIGTAASTTDVLTGTDTTKAVTANALAALWEKGSDVASAATVSLDEGGYFHITGTATITDIDFVTAKDGRFAVLIFDGILTLTHNATTLQLPGGANITTAAGDRAIIVQDASDNIICIAYTRTAGAADVVGPASAVDNRVARFDGTTGKLLKDGGVLTESIIVAVGDETTAITTGTAKVTFRMPYAFTLSAVRASLTTVSSSGLPTIDINEAGATILSTKITIDASEKTSTTAATAPVISDTALADDAEITIDIDVAGTGAAGLKVYLIGSRT